MRKPTVAFVCVHNSCRSQMAEALGKHLAGDVFLSVSAGTEQRDRINQDAVRLMKQRYHIDMEATQRPKLLNELPEVDILPCSHREDWGLDDPTGQPDEVFFAVMDQIEQNILSLKERLQTQEIRWYHNG